MKRFSQGGDSPCPKFLFTCDSDASDDVTAGFPNFLLASQGSTDSDSFRGLPIFPLTSSQSSDFNVEMMKSKEWESPQKFKESLADFVDDVGVSTVANAILQNDALKLELSKILFQETHVEFKKSVKK